jgi:hypothetical protein
MAIVSTVMMVILVLMVTGVFVITQSIFTVVPVIMPKEDLLVAGVVCAVLAPMRRGAHRWIGARSRGASHLTTIG